jgi:hypothetical protein
VDGKVSGTHVSVDESVDNSVGSERIDRQEGVRAPARSRDVVAVLAATEHADEILADEKGSFAVAVKAPFAVTD